MGPRTVNIDNAINREVNAMAREYVNDDERRALVETTGVTLDGKPARITGYRNSFATVQNKSCEVEFAWPTVKRIVERDGKFLS